MRLISHGLDYGLSLLACVGISFSALVLGSIFFSRTAGWLLAAAALVATVSFILESLLSERRARSLQAGLCPRCGEAIVSEHRHRRWDREKLVWQPPLQAWQCRACGFSYSASLACATCPEAS